MRFTPATQMGSQGECVKAYANGSVSGSFTSGSRDFRYHEFKLSNVISSSGFQLTVTQGYTTDARVVVIGGGGAGGWDGTATQGLGGGGGGGNVLDYHNVLLHPGTYNIHVGQGGIPADADNTIPASRTYNGGNGDYSRFWGDLVDIQANGGEGGWGDQADSATYGDGGDSGNGFTGGLYTSLRAGGGAGCTSNGQDGNTVSGRTGNGGTGKLVVLPYTSSAWGTNAKGVGGGGGGRSTAGTSVENIAAGQDGGGDSSQDGDRYSGGGGGGGATAAYTPPNGIGTTGGDGFVIIYYPTTDCNPFWGSGSFQLGTSLLNVCTSPTTTTLYYNRFSSNTLQVGSTYYYDKLFEFPVSSSYIITGSNVYVISGSNGVVTSQTSCSTTVSFASGSATGSACTSTTFNNYYYSGSLAVGTSIYTDYNRTNLVPDNYYKKSGTFDIYNTSTGVVNLITTCSLNCKSTTFNGNGSGGAITFYDCSGSFQSTTVNRLNVFTTCVDVNRPITIGGTVTYTTGSAC